VLESLREHKALPILGRALDMFDSHPAMKLAWLFAIGGFYASPPGQTGGFGALNDAITHRWQWALRALLSCPLPRLTTHQHYVQFGSCFGSGRTVADVISWNGALVAEIRPPL
jgi:hypothetical protein